ncbi:hypothetical protein L6452_27939 [Arctium lappa]|uniref:Uncharacterized protein n=1 Tax=Arctium lappa TaxID=4217 RepID=A0ACB8ZWJ0_ARCLA|nr:hypothetical protein L6452_27939 [Arctium lappa]
MGKLCASAPPLDHRTYRAQITAARERERKKAAEREYLDIPYNVYDDNVDDVDYGPEEERAHEPNADRSNWLEWATDLHSRVTGLESFVWDELIDLRRLIIHDPSTEDIGEGPSIRPPPRRVWGRQSGSSSSSAHQNRDD